MSDPRNSMRHEVLVDSLELESSYIDPAERRAAREKTAARLQMLWERRRFLFRMFLAGLAASLTLALLIPTEYQSTARLMPPDRSSGGLEMLAGLVGKSTSDSLTGLASSVLGLKTTGDLFLGILGSRTVQDDVIRKFDLRKVYGKRRWEDARAALARNTDLSTDRKSGIVVLEVSDRNPQRAAAMTQEYINELDLTLTTQDTSAAHRERVFLEQRLQEVKQNLEVAENNFSDFASKNAALDIPTQGKAMVEASASLQGQLIASETELQGLRQIYTDNNVRVRSTEARIAELQRQLSKMDGAAPTSSRDGSRSAAADPPSDTSFYPSFRKLPALGVTYADLLRSAKVQEAVFEVLTQEYELAKVEEAKELPSVKVLDPPNVPEKPSFLPRLLAVLMGGLVVFAAGSGWIMGLKRWENTDPQDPVKLFASRVFSDVAGDLRGVSRNGAGMRAAGIWRGMKIGESRTNGDASGSGDTSEKQP